MLDKIKTWLGNGHRIDFAELVKQGATILDVRSKREYAVDHITGSVNISVGTLTDNLQMLKGKETPVITCCASGIRSAEAKRILEAYGFSKVYNGGSWVKLQQEIK